jgi:anti-sigma factor RsiW
LAEYLEGDLMAQERVQSERHMLGCPPCAAFLKTYQKSDDLAREILKSIAVPEELNERVHFFLKDRLGLD